MKQNFTKLTLDPKMAAEQLQSMSTTPIIGMDILGYDTLASQISNDSFVIKKKERNGALMSSNSLNTKSSGQSTENLVSVSSVPRRKSDSSDASSASATVNSVSSYKSALRASKESSEESESEAMKPPNKYSSLNNGKMYPNKSKGTENSGTGGLYHSSRISTGESTSYASSVRSTSSSNSAPVARSSSPSSTAESTFSARSSHSREKTIPPSRAQYTRPSETETGSKLITSEANSMIVPSGISYPGRSMNSEPDTEADLESVGPESLSSAKSLSPETVTSEKNPLKTISQQLKTKSPAQPTTMSSTTMNVSQISNETVKLTALKSNTSLPSSSVLKAGTKAMTSDFIQWAKVQPIDALTERVAKDLFRLDKGVDQKGNTLMHAACEVGNISLVQTLLTLHGMKPYSVSNREGFKPIHLACIKGMVHIAMFLVDNKHVSVSEKTTDDSTALHLAANGSHLELISYLLKVFPKRDLWVANIRGYTPLHVACMEGHIEAMKLLASAPDANLTLPDKQGKGCLDIACILGHVALAKAILTLPSRLRPKLDSKSGPNGYTCLHWACANQQYSTIKFLVQDQDVDCKVEDKNGLTPDMLVDDPVVSLLLQCGNMRGKKATSDKENDSGDEEEEENEEEEDEEENDEDEDEENQNQKENEKKTIENNDNRDSEEVESDEENEEEEGSDDNEDSEEEEDGSEASEFDDLLLFEWILDESKLADLEEQLGSAPNILRNTSTIYISPNKETLLHIACKKNAPMTMVQYLVEGVGGDVNQQDLHGLTPLHYAINACNVTIVKYLIKYCGALLDLKDKNGQSVSELCKVLMASPPSSTLTTSSPSQISSNYEEILKVILKGKKKTTEERTKIIIPTIPVSSSTSLVE